MRKRSTIVLHRHNAGLTGKVHLWPLRRYIDDYSPEAARLWIKGTLTMASGTRHKFNDAGELITILGKLNSRLFQTQKREARTLRH